jgi:FKBP-type peptidyl-prolyl cis-trans isomerase FkpA
MSTIRIPALLAVAAAFTLVSSAPVLKPTGDSSVVLKTSSDSISYMVGYDIGRSLKPIKADVKYDILLRGMRDMVEDRKPAMAEQDMQRIGTALNQRMQAEQEKVDQEQGEKNKQREAEFLAKNRNVKGVITTASGLQYSVIKKGAGVKPTATDKVTVQYKGTNLDGVEFDSSYKRGQAASFRLAEVIPGWTEGIQLMPVGSTYKFWIPERLAYGQRSPGPGIGPSEMLIFEVELVSIDK